MKPCVRIEVPRGGNTQFSKCVCVCVYRYLDLGGMLVLASGVSQL